MVLFRSGIEIETGRPALISEGDRGVTLLSPVSRKVLDETTPIAFNIIYEIQKL